MMTPRSRYCRTSPKVSTVHPTSRCVPTSGESLSRATIFAVLHRTGLIHHHLFLGISLPLPTMHAQSVEPLTNDSPANIPGAPGDALSHHHFYIPCSVLLSLTSLTIHSSTRQGFRPPQLFLPLSPCIKPQRSRASPSLTLFSPLYP